MDLVMYNDTAYAVRNLRLVVAACLKEGNVARHTLAAR